MIDISWFKKCKCHCRKSVLKDNTCKLSVVLLQVLFSYQQYGFLGIYSSYLQMISDTSTLVSFKISSNVESFIKFLICGPTNISSFILASL